METRRVTRLLIIVFALLSVLFYFLYRSEYESKSVVSEEFVESAVKNLEINGVSVDASVIKREISESDIYVFDVVSFDKHHNAIIDAIMKNAFDKEVSAEYFNVPGGVAVGFYDVEDSSKELGRVVFSDADFAFNFSKNGVNIAGGDEPIFSSDVSNLPDFTEKTVENIAGILNAEDGCGFRICGVSESDGIFAVSLVQTLEDKDINEVFLNLIFENGELVLIKGRWITFLPKAKYHNSLVDGINALYMLDFENVTEISGEQIVYFFRKGENSRYFLVPGWEISYKDNNGAVRKAYVDAL